MQLKLHNVNWRNQIKNFCMYLRAGHSLGYKVNLIDAPAIEIPESG